METETMETMQAAEPRSPEGGRNLLPVLEAVKWVSLVLLVVFLFAISASGRESATDFETMKAAVTGAAELTEVQEGDNQMVKRLYGLDPAEYDGVLLYYPTTNMGAQELLLVKLKDVSQQEAVAAAVENRVTTQKNSFEGYGVEQFDMLERSITEVRGNYVLLIVAKDPDPVRAAFLAAL